jgi:hypothetical protein
MNTQNQEMWLLHILMMVTLLLNESTAIDVSDSWMKIVIKRTPKVRPRGYSIFG